VEAVGAVVAVAVSIEADGGRVSTPPVSKAVTDGLETTVVVEG